MDAPPPAYAALGDSYSSGVGTADYSWSGDCKRGPRAYPALVARKEGLGFRFRACSGAETADVEPVPATRLVTITIGGNDAGFSSVIRACAPPWPWSCSDEIAEARRFIRRRLPARLDRLFRAIRRAARRALVLIVGYPRIFAEREECDAARIDVDEQRAMNGVADLLARVTRERALRRERFDYVDVRRAFDEHQVCDPHPWINGLEWPVGESYHPNRAGHRAYARAIRSNLP